jgi:hypothetical protein
MSIDFRKILSRYIAHVGEHEGIDYLGQYHGHPSGLTSEEIVALCTVALEDMAHKEHAAHLRSVIEEHEAKLKAMERGPEQNAKA